MKRGTLTRTTRLRPVNPKRRRARRLAAFGPKADWIRGLPCCLCGAVPYDDYYSHPHHVETRGRNPVSNKIIPACWRCHDDLEHRRVPEAVASRFPTYRNLKAHLDRLVIEYDERYREERE